LEISEADSEAHISILGNEESQNASAKSTRQKDFRKQRSRTSKIKLDESEIVEVQEIISLTSPGLRDNFMSPSPADASGIAEQT